MKTMLAVADEWLSAERNRLAASGETVYTGHQAHIVEWLLEEVRRRTLTGAEREAIVTALAFLREEAYEPAVAQEAATLRGLLERTK